MIGSLIYEFKNSNCSYDVTLKAFTLELPSLGLINNGNGAFFASQTSEYVIGALMPFSAKKRAVFCLSQQTDTHSQSLIITLAPVCDSIISLF